MTSKNTNAQTYVIRRIQNQDIDGALNFLRETFFREELLNICLKLVDSSGNCKPLEDFARASMMQGVSLMAETQSGQIISVLVNDISEREKIKSSAPSADRKFRTLQQFFETLDSKVDFFNRYPAIDKVFNLKMLSVDKEWRRAGLSVEILTRSSSVAKEEECAMMRADSTNYISTKILEKLNFEVIYTLKYADYKVNGEIVFQLDAPNTEMRVLVKNVQ